MVQRLSNAHKFRLYCTPRLDARTIVDTRECPEWGAKEHGNHANAKYLHATAGEVDHHELHW